MQSQVHVLMGMRGTGKTTLLRRILNPRPDRLVVIDSLGELARLGFVQGVDAETFRQTLLTRATYRIGIYPRDEAIFEWVCGAVAARHDITLAIEELDRWFPNTASQPPQELLDIALVGRHYGQSLVCVVHRPVTIHHSILSQAILWVFPMIDANDRRTVQMHSRRTNAPDGLDPGDLQVVETDVKGNVLVTEVARVSLVDVQILHFDLRTGSLSAPE